MVLHTEVWSLSVKPHLSKVGSCPTRNAAAASAGMMARLPWVVVRRNLRYNGTRTFPLRRYGPTTLYSLKAGGNPMRFFNTEGPVNCQDHNCLTVWGM